MQISLCFCFSVILKTYVDIYDLNPPIDSYGADLHSSDP